MSMGLETSCVHEDIRGNISYLKEQGADAEFNVR